MATDVVSSPTEAGLTLFLVQVFVILVLVRALASLLKAMHQPVVIGEILAGVLLGPSLLGQIPGFSDTIFPPDSLPLLKLISSIALIFFMFFLGMELEVSLMLRTWKSTAPTAVVAFFVSFFVGIIVAPLLATVDDSMDVTDVGTVYRLFVGMSFAFSAFPVLARVLSNHKLLPTTLGIQALSCAAVDDIVDWVVLALSLSYAAHGTISGGLYTALIFICFVLGSFMLVQPALAYVHRRLLARDDELNKNFIALIFLLLLVMCWMTQVIGVQAFFGAFICGVVMPREGCIARELSSKIELLIKEFLLPLYFAYSGIFTDITKLNTVQSWVMVLAMSAFATAAKVISCCLMTRFTSGRFGWEEGQRTLDQIYNDSKEARVSDASTPVQVHDHRLGPLLDLVAPSSASGGAADAEVGEHFVIGNAQGPLRASQAMEAAHSPSVSVSVAGQLDSQSLQQDNALVHGASIIGVDSSSASTLSDDPSRSPSPTFFTAHQSTDWFGLKRYEPAPWDACWALGFLMNTRGLVALIVLNVALENDYLSITSFTILLLMALLTTFITSPLVFAFYTRKWNRGLEEAEAEAEAEAMAREFMKPLGGDAETGGAALPRMVPALPLHEWKQPFDQVVSLHCIPVMIRPKHTFFLGAHHPRRPASPPTVAKWLGSGAGQAPTEWQGPAVDYEHGIAEEEEEKTPSPTHQTPKKQPQPQQPHATVSASQVRFHVDGCAFDDPLTLSPVPQRGRAPPPASARSAAGPSASQSWNRSTPTAADLSARSGGGGGRLGSHDRADSSSSSAGNSLSALASRGVDLLLTNLFPASKPFGASPALARQQSAAAAAAAAAAHHDATEAEEAAAAISSSLAPLPALQLSPRRGAPSSSFAFLPSLDPRSLQIPHAAQIDEAAKMRRHVRKRMQDKENLAKQRGQTQKRSQQQQQPQQPQQPHPHPHPQPGSASSVPGSHSVARSRED